MNFCDTQVNAEQLVQFFSQAGEVMFVRMAGDENLPSRNAYVEFTNQRSVPVALAYNGVPLLERHVKLVASAPLSFPSHFDLVHCNIKNLFAYETRLHTCRLLSLTFSLDIYYV